MPSLHAMYLGLLSRALLYIALVSALLYAGTRDKKIVGAYALAHVVALGGGALVDLLVFTLVFHGESSTRLMQWIFAAPVFLFTAVSVYLCDRVSPAGIADALLPLGAIVAWGCAIIWGPQAMDGVDVLGAWFVAAAAGAVDLYSLRGPEWARKRRLTARLAGYAASIALIYVLLPRL